MLKVKMLSCHTHVFEKNKRFSEVQVEIEEDAPPSRPVTLRTEWKITKFVQKDRRP